MMKQIPGRGAIILLLVLAAACLLSFAIIPSGQRIEVYPDDALFYGIIAWNTADGHAFSFDGGATRTTGFHWGGMVVPLLTAYAAHHLVGIDTYQGFFPILFFVDAAVLALCALLIVGAVARRIRSWPVIALLFLVVAQALVRGFGMEMVLLPLILLAYILRNPNQPAAGRGYLLLSFLAVVTRIDAALVVLAISLWLCILHPLRSADGLPAAGATSRRRAFRSICVPTAAGILAGAALVSLLNLLVDGSLQSSSLLVKSAMARVSFGGLKTALLDGLPFALLFLGLIAASLAARGRRFLVSAVAGAGLLGLLYVIALRGLENTKLGGWYDIGWLVLLAVAGGLLAAHLLAVARTRFAKAAILLGTAVVFALIMPRDLIRLRLQMNRTGEARYWEDLADIGRRINAVTPPEARLLVSDLPGRLTYFSGRDVTALDGLANSTRYIREFLLTGRVGEYLAQQSGYVLLLLGEAEAARLDSMTSIDPDGVGRARVGFPYGSDQAMSEFTFPLRDVRLRCPRSGEKGELWMVRLPGRATAREGSAPTSP